MTELELIGGELQEKPEAAPEPIKPKRKYRRRKKAARGSGQPKKTVLAEGWLDGISAGSCPIACNEEKCLITGENVCGHPYKGGLQARYLQMKDVLGRFGNARSVIAHQEAESKRK